MVCYCTVCYPKSLSALCGLWLFFQQFSFSFLVLFFFYFIWPRGAKEPPPYKMYQNYLKDHAIICLSETCLTYKIIAITKQKNSFLLNTLLNELWFQATLPSSTFCYLYISIHLLKRCGRVTNLQESLSFMIALFRLCELIFCTAEKQVNRSSYLSPRTKWVLQANTWQRLTHLLHDDPLVIF